MRREGSYLFVVTALILGLGLGLLISLVISPVNYQNVPPSMLRPADKDLYRAMIALSFNARGDMGRAQARLELLRRCQPAGAAGRPGAAIHCAGQTGRRSPQSGFAGSRFGKGSAALVYPLNPS